MKRKKQYTIVRSMKLTDFDFRVLIAALTNYRLRKKAAGKDSTEISRLWVKVYTAYES